MFEPCLLNQKSLFDGDILLAKGIHSGFQVFFNQKLPIPKSFKSFKAFFFDYKVPLFGP